jgi:hypothetical protein
MAMIAMTARGACPFYGLTPGDGMIKLEIVK